MEITERKSYLFYKLLTHFLTDFLQFSLFSQHKQHQYLVLCSLLREQQVTEKMPDCLLRNEREGGRYIQIYAVVLITSSNHLPTGRNNNLSFISTLTGSFEAFTCDERMVSLKLFVVFLNLVDSLTLVLAFIVFIVLSLVEDFFKLG